MLTVGAVGFIRSCTIDTSPVLSKPVMVDLHGFPLEHLLLLFEVGLLPVVFNYSDNCCTVIGFALMSGFLLLTGVFV